MFHQPAHPALFAMHGHGHHQSCPLPTAAQVKLPRTLARPHFHDVDPAAIASVAPELADVPAEYIRRGLRSQAEHMLASLSTLSISDTTRAQIPGFLAAPSSCSSVNPPTHVLALSSKFSAAQDPALLVPIHALVLATHCARLPALSVNASPSILPVLPLTLPHPTAFQPLLSYLYTHSPDALLRSMLPFPSTFLRDLTPELVRTALSSGPVLHALSEYLCGASNGNLQGLMVYAGRVKDVWQNVVALGVFDAELWDVLDLAWEVVLGGLNLAAATE